MPQGQVTKFVSGDDLEDDFLTEDKDKEPVSDLKDDNNVKPKKKKQGPKIVKFVG